MRFCLVEVSFLALRPWVNFPQATRLRCWRPSRAISVDKLELPLRDRRLAKKLSGAARLNMSVNSCGLTPAPINSGALPAC